MRVGQTSRKAAGSSKGRDPFASRYAACRTSFRDLCAPGGISRADVPLSTQRFPFCVSQAAFRVGTCRFQHNDSRSVCPRRRFVSGRAAFNTTNLKLCAPGGVSSDVPDSAKKGSRPLSIPHCVPSRQSGAAVGQSGGCETSKRSPSQRLRAACNTSDHSHPHILHNLFAL